MQREFSVFSRACPSARSTAAESAELAFGDRWGIHPFPLSLSFPILAMNALFIWEEEEEEKMLCLSVSPPTDATASLAASVGLGRSASVGRPRSVGPRLSSGVPVGLPVIYCDPIPKIMDKRDERQS